MRMLYGFMLLQALVAGVSAQTLFYFVSPYLSTRAVALLRTNGTNEALGTIQFSQAFLYGPVTVAGTISGLKPGFHGFTIHQYGDNTHGCNSSGVHFNPDHSNHGANTDLIRHVGDLGNIQVDDKGMATVSLSDPVITLHGKNNIIGRTLVVHAFKDDLGKGGNGESLITGNSGPGIACGTIGLTNEIP